MVRRQSELDQNTPDHHTLGLPKLVITASIFHGADCGLERHLHEPRKAAKLESVSAGEAAIALGGLRFEKVVKRQTFWATHAWTPGLIPAAAITEMRQLAVVPFRSPRGTPCAGSRVSSPPSL